MRYLGQDKARLRFACEQPYGSGAPNCERSFSVLFLEQYILFELYQALNQRLDTEFLWKEREGRIKVEVKEVKEVKEEQLRLKKRQMELKKSRLRKYEEYDLNNGSVFESAEEE